MKVGELVRGSKYLAPQTQASAAKSPLVVHIVHRFAVGGLENGLVNLINATPSERYRHAIICLTDYTDFRSRICQSDVPVIALQKRDGNDFRTHLRLWHVLKELHPAIVHTRNLPALEFLSVAALAGVAGRIHGEHGRDVYDLDGSSRKYNLLRKAVSPFASCYTSVSHHLAEWLVRTVGIRKEKVFHVCNGVDVHRFHPRNGALLPVGPEGFIEKRSIVVGTVGRMQTVKDQPTLVRGFLQLVQKDPEVRKRLRLVMIGDGPLRAKSQQLLREAGAESLAWLPGERNDIPEIMRSFDIFVLPSIAEGISNTILEAMATGLPVVATRVGGNPELVVEGETGTLVPPSSPTTMAEAIHSYLIDPVKRLRHGLAGRKRAEEHFSIEKMVEGYLGVYDEVLKQRKGRSRYFGFRNADYKKSCREHRAERMESRGLHK